MTVPLKKNTPITSASHAVPFANCLCRLLCDVDTMAMKPFITVITATVDRRGGKWGIQWQHCISLE